MHPTFSQFIQQYLVEKNKTYAHNELSHFDGRTMITVDSLQDETVRRDQALQAELGGRGQMITQMRNENIELRGALLALQTTAGKPGFENYMNRCRYSGLRL